VAPLPVALVPGRGQAQTNDHNLVFLWPFTDPGLHPGWACIYCIVWEPLVLLMWWF